MEALTRSLTNFLNLYYVPTLGFLREKSMINEDNISKLIIMQG